MMSRYVVLAARLTAPKPVQQDMELVLFSLSLGVNSTRLPAGRSRQSRQVVSLNPNSRAANGTFPRRYKAKKKIRPIGQRVAPISPFQGRRSGRARLFPYR